MSKSLNRIIEMLTIQDELNRHHDVEWRYRLSDTQLRSAILVETAELLEHLGYKWWKQNPVNLAQAQLEVVDIWHFLLSLILQSGMSHHTVLENLNNINTNRLNPINQEQAIYLALRFINTSINTISINSTGIGSSLSQTLEVFSSLARGLSMNLDCLYKLYLGKSVLNIFRWNHGYKENLYTKNWDGKEDNEHLMEIMNSLETNELSSKVILQKLEEIYPG